MPGRLKTATHADDNDMERDIVYIVGEKGDGFELRYSLRSLQNLPHRQVFIVGHKPEWVRNVIHVPTEQPRSKYSNARDNIRAAARDPRVSEDFVLMNDDFFILAPVADVPVWHHGDLKDFVRGYKNRGPYYQRLKGTVEIIAGLNRRNPMIPNGPFYARRNYELHVPAVFNKARILELAERFEHAGKRAFRSLYGNYYRIGGEYHEDVKFVRHLTERSVPADFMSTSNEFAETAEFRDFIRARFPDPSPYEA